MEKRRKDVVKTHGFDYINNVSCNFSCYTSTGRLSSLFFFYDSLLHKSFNISINYTFFLTLLLLYLMNLYL